MSREIKYIGMDVHKEGTVIGRHEGRNRGRESSSGNHCDG